MRELYPLFLGLILLFVAACTARGDEPTVGGPVPEHVISYTSGTIGRDAAIVVTLDTLYPASAVRLSPEPDRPGTQTHTGRQLRFTPDDPLTADTRYVFTLRVEGKPPFAFEVRTPPRRLEVIPEGYYVPDPDRPDQIELRGRVLTNDRAEPEEVAAAIRIRYRDRRLPVRVVREGYRAFTYTATVNERGRVPSVATLAYGGEGAFAGAERTADIRIPPAGSFEVLAVEPQRDGSGLLVRLSGAVARDQDLAGLIELSPQVPFTTAVDGNFIYVYPRTDTEREVTLRFDPALRGAVGNRLGQVVNWKVPLATGKPGLRAVGNGSIMPHRGKRYYTFEAIGLRAVYLEVFRIQDQNVLQFLQEEALGQTSGDWTLRRVGHTVEQRILPLDELGGNPAANTWTRYAIDLDDYVADDRGGIYQLRLGFGREHTLQVCGDSSRLADLPTLAARLEEAANTAPGFSERNSLLGAYGSIYGPAYWEDRESPCSPAYYGRQNFLIRNVLSSNLGLMAKRNPDRTTLIYATDLLAAGPREGVAVTVYSYDQRELGGGRTDGEGKVVVSTDDPPAFVRAQAGDDVAYLQLDRNDALPLGRFAVDGRAAAGGVSGAFFAERGVWRPGDSIYLHFVLRDRDDRLPADYPVQLTVADARGRVVDRRSVRPFGEEGLYALPLGTSSEDETGSWTATVNAAGQTYRHRLLVEAVKPNRLAIDVGPAANGSDVQLRADWLYGAPAAGLRARVEASAGVRQPDFPSFGDFAFTDPARPLNEPVGRVVFDEALGPDGQARFSLPEAAGRLPGPMSLALTSRVYEPGGNFSVDRSSIPYDPYPVYAGMRLPRSEWGESTLPVDGRATVDLVAVSPAGVGRGARTLRVGIYRVGWRYWWQDGNDNVARFGAGEHTEAIDTYTVTTSSDGRASLSLGVEDWGRYLLRACDEGGHCSGAYFYGGSPTEGNNDRESASLLRLRTAQDAVTAGEEVRMEVPSSQGGRLLVSLETSVGSIEQFWVPAQAGQTTVTFRTDARMVPTVYANVTLLQPYEQTTNDRPVRLYGVVPITVTDPATRLQPEIDVADSWRPRTAVDITVGEAEGRPMTYVIDVVDEGLLGLTNFRTPDLHADFFAKEALAVASFDVYDEVMSSINGEFGRVLAVGGDGTVVNPEDASANRFPPVVRHLGPFRLAAGRRKHTVELPNYLGAVRVMVTALNEGAYGSAEARVPVRQPLMVLPTLPRVLAPDEQVDMPVNVFTTEDRLRRAELGVIDASGLVQTPERGTAVSFGEERSRLAYLPLTVGSATGTARLTVEARGGSESSTQEVTLRIRPSNGAENRVSTVAVAPGQTIEVDYDPFGLPTSRSAVVELSGLPSMGLNRHLRDLLRYPYGCAEQVVSAAFAQLSLPGLLELTAEQEARRIRNITEGIEEIRRFTVAGGGVAYWPGQRGVHPWASSYALHFLLEAERAGFGVPYALREDLLRFQRAAATNWDPATNSFYVAPDQLFRDQAYRLYGLALAGQADVGAMNRLRGEADQLPVAARYQLAAAYGLVGRSEEGKQLLSGAAGEIKDYRELGFTFGSEIRDMAMCLESYLRLGDGRAAEQALRLARAVGDRDYLSTQEAAFVFVAISKLAAGGQTVRAEIVPPGTRTPTTVGINQGVQLTELPTESSGRFTVRNTGSATLYVSTQLSGIPAAGDERPASNQLDLRVAYTDLNGRLVNVSDLPSGTDFLASYTVTHPGGTGRNYRQLALVSRLPSGWEVSNARLDETGPVSDAFTHQDYRDDRVHTFFDLGVGESKTFRFRMTATYPGRYYLPAQTGEAMYDPGIRAAVGGKWVTVSRSR